MLSQYKISEIQPTLGGLKGYSGEKCISRKNTPPS